jgi:hypothetical protein
MSIAQAPSSRKPRRTGGRIAALIIALVALAAIAAVWFWTSLLAVAVPLFGWQNLVIVGGGGVFCLSVLAVLGAGFDDILEWIWAVVAAMGAVIVAVFWGIMALFGFD